MALRTFANINIHPHSESRAELAEKVASYRYDEISAISENDASYCIQKLIAGFLEAPKMKTKMKMECAFQLEFEKIK